MIKLEISGQVSEVAEKVLELAKYFGRDLSQLEIPLTVRGKEWKAETAPIDHEAMVNKVIAEPVEVEAETAEQPKKERKPRAKKEEKVAEVVEEVESLGDEAGDEATDESEEEVVIIEEAKEPLTKQAIADTFQKLSGKKGIDAARNILAQFKNVANEKCRRISELQEADFEAVMEACMKELA